jgi:hypothetical protein
MSQIPFTTASGLVLTSTGDGQGGAVWGSASGQFGLTFNYTGATGVGFVTTPTLVPVVSTNVVTFVGVLTICGGVLIGDFNYNGTAITGMTGSYVDYVPEYFTPTTPIVITNNDYFTFDVTAVYTASTYLNMTFIFTT